MATTTDLLVDAFGRIRDGVGGVLEGLSEAALVWRPDPQANTIAWLIWHLTRIQDDHLADAFENPQVWVAGGWVERMALPFSAQATGYGQTGQDVGKVGVSADLLLGYHHAVCERTVRYLGAADPDDLDRVVDRNWDPAVTLAVRLVSVIADDLEHLGQASYIRGLADRAGV